jgi:hypothetical protein
MCFKVKISTKILGSRQRHITHATVIAKRCGMIAKRYREVLV